VCVPPPPPLVQAEGHTRLRERGGPNSDAGTYTVILYVYMYFVGKSLQVPAHGVMALTRYQVYLNANETITLEQNVYYSI
jgi:hypothetical protein